MGGAHLLWHSADVCEALPEDDKDAPRPAAQGRGGTVKGRVPCPKDDHRAVEGGQGTTTRAHPYREKLRISEIEFFHINEIINNFISRKGFFISRNNMLSLFSFYLQLIRGVAVA